MVSRVYDLITSVTNQYSLLHNRKVVWFLILLCGYFRCKSSLLIAWYWSWVISKEVENMSWSKVRDKLGKPVLALLLQNILKDILCPFNSLVSRVNDISTAASNQCSLLHNHERGVRGVWFLISLCGYLQVWVRMSTWLFWTLSQSKGGDQRKYKKIKGKS